MTGRSFLLRIALAVGFGGTTGAALGQEKKYGGQLFDAPQGPAAGTSALAVAPGGLGTNPTRNTTAFEGPTESSPSELPALRVKILIPSQSPVPQELSGRLSPESQPFLEPSPSGRQYTLRSLGREDIEPALKSQIVSNVEIVRPPSFGPVGPPPVGNGVTPFNLNAQITHSVPTFLATFSEVTEHGKTVVAGVFDEGAIRSTHVEFAVRRVTLKTSKAQSMHSTHVCGTMCATGVKAAAQGMASKLSVLGFDWENDLNRLDSIASQIQISNHSYGPLAGWSWDEPRRQWYWWGDTSLSETEDAKFGKYSGDNQQLDAILARHTHLLTFASAGNDRDEGPISQPVAHFVPGQDPATGKLVWLRSTKVRNRDGSDNGGLDTVCGLGLSKNAICIGAINDAINSSDRLVTTYFSGWGPADDGRIKPDLVANGDRLISSSDEDDSSYIEMSGTSMSSPTAAGIGALLVEMFTKTKKRAPIAAEIKAVMIHTATDAGVPGPDPVYGWGSINALRCGRVIAGNGGATVRKEEVAAGQEKVFRLSQAANGGAVRVTVVWTDPPAPANTGGLDDATPTLQNDLDAELTAPDGATFFPYSLVRTNPLAPAIRTGPNKVDNVEVIDANPMKGDWVIKVRATRLRSGDKQVFAIVSTGLTESR